MPTNQTPCRQGFTRVPNGFLAGAPRRCKDLLIELMGAAPGFNPTFKLLADRLGCSRRTVYYNMALLQKTGCITRVSTDGKNRIVWQVNKPEDRAAASEVYNGPIVQTAGATNCTPEGATNCTQLGATNCTPNKTKNHNKQSRPIPLTAGPENELREFNAPRPGKLKKFNPDTLINDLVSAVAKPQLRRTI